MDSDVDFRTALATNLREDGHQVLDTASPQDLLPLATLREVALAIVNDDLESEGGVGFADRFHAACPGVPVILVSSLPTDRLERAASARSFVTLLCKPVNYESLHEVIVQLLRPAR